MRDVVCPREACLHWTCVRNLTFDQPNLFFLESNIWHMCQTIIVKHHMASAPITLKHTSSHGVRGHTRSYCKKIKNEETKATFCWKICWIICAIKTKCPPPPLTSIIINFSLPASPDQRRNLFSHITSSSLALRVIVTLAAQHKLSSLFALIPDMDAASCWCSSV